MSKIFLDHISKRYGAVEIMSDLNLRIEKSEFCVLVGPSGCGKSTLLRMIAGLETVSEGTIFMDGSDVTHRRPGERDLAMVFQSYALYPHKTVRDNFGFSLRMRGYDKADSSERIRKVSSTLGLDKLLDRHPAQLSGGQRQRVAMGRAMVRDPSVFLFDEPLSNLDAKLRVKMRGEIRDLHQRINATTIYVTHDQIEAMTMADRIVVMNGGNIEQAGPPLELFDNPRNVFVAGFLGSPAINLIDGTVCHSDGGLAVELKSGARLLVDGLREEFANRPVTLGIRPHHLFLDDAGKIQAEVKVVEPTGVETVLVSDFAGDDIVSQLTRQALPRPGEAVSLNVKPSDVLVFDKACGERI